MRVLVTGANGFLGSHLVRLLLEKNYEVLALVRDTSDVNFLKELNCRIVVGDILNLSSLLGHFGGLDGVFHVAGAMTSSPKSRHEKKRLFEVNIVGVQNVLTACIQKHIKKLVHVSSAVAVGTNLHSSDPWLNENSVNITSELGYLNYDSKRIGEALVLEASKKGQLDAVVVNPGLIYGACDAKKSMRKGNVLAAKGKLPFYPTGGVNIVAVEDVTEAILSAFLKGRNGERYLLTGDNISIQELLSTISTIAHNKPPSKKLPMNFLKWIASVLELLKIPSEICHENIFSTSSFHWYENEKAKRELDFNPRNYQEALKSSVKWMKENHYL